MSKINRAFMVARSAHLGQKRKYSDMDYIVHPVHVATILASHGVMDEDVICAALLHDVVEDTDLTENDLRKLFSDRVIDLVMEVTEISKLEDGNRKIRKELDRQHYARGSYEGQTIKFADMSANSESIIAYDPDFSVVYMRELNDMLDIMTNGLESLRNECISVIADYYGIKLLER